MIYINDIYPTHFPTQDTATRTIASLNQVAVDFQFVMKTKLSQHPLKIIFLFTLCFWIGITWTITQCERCGNAYFHNHMSFSYSYASVYDTYSAEAAFRQYMNFCWFVIVTYFSIGYGDIVPNTYCGRSLAILTGIVGLFVSSIFIAVMVQKIDLTRSEKQVNQVCFAFVSSAFKCAFLQVVAQSQICRNYREAAAEVLQQAWFTHKYNCQANSQSKRALSQKKLLLAIHE